MIHKNYPQLCGYYFRLWIEKEDSGTSILDEILKKLANKIPKFIEIKERNFLLFILKVLKK